MRYQDKRGWLYEVQRGRYSILWTIYCFNPAKEKWRAWTTSNWYDTQKEAERALERFAKKRGWEAV